MNTPSNEPRWLDQAKGLLDESADHLDAATLSRLNRARQAALGQRRRRALAWLPAGLVGACTMLLAVMLWHGRGHGGAPELPLDAHGAGAGDVELVSSDDSLEFYQDLEFYAWLEAQQEQDLGS